MFDETFWWLIRILLNHLIESSQCNIGAFSDLVNGSENIPSLIVRSARYYPHLLGILTTTIMLVTKRPRQTVSHWLNKGDVPSAYLDTVFKCMAKVGYDMRPIKDAFLSFFRSTEPVEIIVPQSSLKDMWDRAFDLLHKIRRTSEEDNGLNTEERMDMIFLGTELKQMGEQYFSRGMDDIFQKNLDDAYKRALEIHRHKKQIKELEESDL